MASDFRFFKVSLRVMAGMAAFGLWSGEVRAEKISGPLSHEFVEEIQGPKTYAAVLELWATGENSLTLTATPRTESSDLRIISGAKAWKNAKAGKRFRYKVEVQNTGSETRALYIDLKRTTAKNHTDAKTITVMVPPP